MEYETVGTVFRPSEISFNDFIELWIENHLKVNCKLSSANKTISLVNNTIRKYFKNYKLKSIKPLDCNNFFNELMKEGKYSLSTIKVIKTRLVNIFNFAIYPYNYIKDNPAKYIKIKNDKHKIENKTISLVNNTISL